jgi:Ala-tRNA(Pro) deacylase
MLLLQEPGSTWNNIRRGTPPQNTPKRKRNMNGNTVFQELLRILPAEQVRILEHAPEGNTERASKVRGNPLSEAAKAMVFVVAGKGEPQYCLAVVGGDRRVDSNALKVRFHGSYAGLAPQNKAEELTGCVLGSIPPFTFRSDLKLVVDRQLLENSQIVFNAGRLDCSMFLAVSAYLEAAKPIIADISRRNS